MFRLLAFVALFFLALCSANAQQPDDIPSNTGDIGTTLLDSEPERLAATENGSLPDMPIDPFARDGYRLDPVVCPFRGEVDYKPGDFDCFLLEVPENRENQDSRFIELHVIRINSRWGKDDFEDNTEETGLDAGKRADPVIYLTGGPGVTGTHYVKRLRDHGILDHRDLYILEQRGIGYSDDFCPQYGGRNPAMDDTDNFEESLAAGNERVRLCAENAMAAGIDLAGYNTIENARDVKALRRALGLQKWNVWGISYGSILGQAYIKEDPEGILAVALDAIMPLDVRDSDEHWRVIRWYMRDLEKLQTICDTQPRCAEHYPDIIGRLREAVKSVEGNPIEVDVFDTEVYPGGKARIFRNIVAMLPFIYLYEQKNYPALPALVYAWADAVERRDEHVFAALADMMAGSGMFSSSQGMANAIHCTDGGRAAQARANVLDREDFPVLGQAMGTAESDRLGVALCAELGMATRPDSEYTPAETGLPSLIIEGDMDPITPPPNAKAILPGFSNATYVEFPFAGHGPSRSVECGGAMLNAFFDNPNGEPELDCTLETEMPVMIAPLFTSTAVPRAAAIAAEDRKKLVPAASWLGSSLLISLLAFVVMTASPLLRWIDGRDAIPAGIARFWAWAAATATVTAASVLGAAIGITAESYEALALFGFPSWAAIGAWAGLAAGILGIAAVQSAWRARRVHALPPSRVAGFTLTGLAAVVLSLFLYFWGLGPF